MASGRFAEGIGVSDTNGAPHNESALRTKHARGRGGAIAVAASEKTVGFPESQQWIARSAVAILVECRADCEISCNVVAVRIVILDGSPRIESRRGL